MDEEPPEITGRAKREERANVFKLRQGWLRVPGSSRLLPPQDAVRILQHQQFPQMPSAIEYQSNHDKQLEHYQTTVQQSLQQQNQALQEYQRTMQQVFGIHQPQDNASGFVYEPATPAPNLSNPAPRPWDRPTTKSDATVIPPSQPGENTSHQSEPQPELQTKSSTAAEKTSQQPTAKKKSRMGPLTDQRLAIIQKTQSSILNYTPKAQSKLSTSTPAAESLSTVLDYWPRTQAKVPNAEFPLLKDIAQDFEHFKHLKPESQSSASNHRHTAQADIATSTPASDIHASDSSAPEFPIAKADTLTWMSTSEFPDSEFSASEFSPAQADTSTWLPTTDLFAAEADVPTSKFFTTKADAAALMPASDIPDSKFSTTKADAATLMPVPESPVLESAALEFPTAQADKPTLENISQDFEHVLLSEPDGKWTIHDIPVGLSSLERLKGKYSDNTFQLLRATTRNPRPAEVHILLSDEGLDSLPVTEKTTDVLFIVFQPNRFAIGHWVVVWLNLVGVQARYYDVVGPDRDPKDQAFLKSCGRMIKFLNAGLADKGLDPPGDFMCHREQTFQRGDGENCGPVSWAYVEAALDPGNKAAIFEDPRLRHITQVYQALVDVGVPKPSMTSDDVVVCRKRKQIEVPLPNEKHTKKVAKTSSVQEFTMDRPRRQPRVPGQYREIPPLPSSDSDDDYIPTMQDTEDEEEDEEEDEDLLSEDDNGD